MSHEDHGHGVHDTHGPVVLDHSGHGNQHGGQGHDDHGHSHDQGGHGHDDHGHGDHGHGAVGDYNAEAPGPSTLPSVNPAIFVVFAIGLFALLGYLAGASISLASSKVPGHGGHGAGHGGGHAEKHGTAGDKHGEAKQGKAEEKHH